MSLRLEAARRAEPRASSRREKRGRRQTPPWTPVTTHPLATLRVPWRRSRIGESSRTARTSGPQPPGRPRLLVTRATRPKPRPRLALPGPGPRPRPLRAAARPALRTSGPDARGFEAGAARGRPSSRMRTGASRGRCPGCRPTTQAAGAVDVDVPAGGGPARRSGGASRGRRPRAAGQAALRAPAPCPRRRRLVLEPRGRRVRRAPPARAWAAGHETSPAQSRGRAPASLGS